MLPGMINKATHQLRIVIAIVLVTLSLGETGLAYKIDERTNKATGQLTHIAIADKDDTLNTMVRDILDASGVHLTEEQIIQIIHKVLEDNTPRIQRDGVLAPKQRVDLSAAMQLAITLKQLNDSGVRVIAKLRLNTETITPTEVCFLNITNSQTLDFSDECLGLSVPDAHYIFIEISSFPDAITRYRTFYSVFEDNSGWRTVYSGKTEDYIAQRYIVDTLYHEDIHILTMPTLVTSQFRQRFWADPLLRKYAGSRYSQRIAEELAAYLGEVSYTKEPLLILEILFKYAEETGPTYKEVPQEYIYTGQVLKVLLAHKLRYEDYLINCEVQRQNKGKPQGLLERQKDGIRKEIAKKYNHGDCLSIKPARNEEKSKWVEFINSLSNDQLRQAATDIFAEKYPGVPLADLFSVELPGSVMDEYRHMQHEHVWDM